jgi:virginiamycin B lyase
MTLDGSLRQHFTPGRCTQPEAVMWTGQTLWFTTLVNDGIWRFRPGHAPESIPIPTADGDPLALAQGSDGNVWFTEYFGNKIGVVVLNP